jgi:heme/copper-type cytochrome/quinol oxidase subunit 1
LCTSKRLSPDLVGKSHSPSRYGSSGFNSDLRPFGQQKSSVMCLCTGVIFGTVFFLHSTMKRDSSELAKSGFFFRQLLLMLFLPLLMAGSTSMSTDTLFGFSGYGVTFSVPVTDPGGRVICATRMFWVLTTSPLMSWCSFMTVLTSNCP